MNCSTITLGAEARSYIIAELQNGLCLAEKLLTAQNFSKGDVLACTGLLDNQGAIIERSAKELKWGGVSSPYASLQCLSRFIARFLAENNDGICVFENYNAEPTPEWLSGLRSKSLIHGQDVLTVVDNRQASDEEIKTAIQESESGWIFIGCLATIVNASKVLGKEVAENVLKDIAAGAQHVIVSAFDGEGYIIWSETDS